MEISFRTKKEANKKQLIDFLSLSKTERFFYFLNLSRKINAFPTKAKPKHTSNFIIS